MALVDYASSESPEEASPKPVAGLKRKRSASTESKKALPPLPATFRDLYASAARISTDDDPSLHNGRQRAAPHVDGNWPTHVYLEWFPSTSETDLINELIQAVGQRLLERPGSASSERLHSLLTNDLGVSLPLHISLSAPLALKAERREAYLEAITARINKISVRGASRSAASSEGAKLGSGLRKTSFREGTCSESSRESLSSTSGALKVRLRGVSWVSNAEETRWFLVLRIVKPEGDELNKLLRACNDVAVAQKLPKLYDATPDKKSGWRPDSYTGKRGRSKAGFESSRDELQGGYPHDSPDPSVRGEDSADLQNYFHFSVAWSLQDPSQEGHKQEAVQSIDLPKDALAAIEQLEVTMDAVKVKIGNSVTSLPFDKKQTGSRGMLE